MAIDDNSLEMQSSQVTVSVGDGVSLPSTMDAELADFAAEACETLAALEAEPEEPGACRVDVLITTSAEMRELNRRFRHKSQPTDVISFPTAKHGDNAIEGDIAISAEIAKSQAKRLGHSIEEELKVLILHGMLHLAGFDHETDHGEMATLEGRLRREFGLPDALIERVEKKTARKKRRAAGKSVAGKKRRVTKRDSGKAAGRKRRAAGGKRKGAR